MKEEVITSRKNSVIRRFRLLGRDAAFRREQGEFLCDGEKLFREAQQNGAEITAILCRENGAAVSATDAAVYTAAEEVFDYASPLENSPGPLFAVKIPSPAESETPDRVIVLENVQDPGNVGTVLRTAAALGTELVILCGNCADPYHPKTVRATMGAVFRQKVVSLTLPELKDRLQKWGLTLYGAALADDAEDLRTVSFARAAVAVGNEGKGLSGEMLSLCEKKIIIPMTAGSESLNAGVAASILMWEMGREAL